MNAIKTKPDYRTRLFKFFLIFLKGTWILLFTFMLGTFLFALPAFYNSLFDLSYSQLTFGWTALETRMALSTLGLSDSFFATSIIAVAGPFTFSFFIIGLVIFWFRHRDWFGLLVSITLVGIGWGLFSIPETRSFPGSEGLFSLIYTLSLIGVQTLFFVFPDGKFVPRWTKWLVLGIAMVQVISVIVPIDNNGGIYAVLYLFVLGSMVYAPLYRYKNCSDRLQRQQIKWVVFSLAGSLTALLLIGFLPLVVWKLLDSPSWVQLLHFLIGGALMTLVFMMVPVSITIAILRYRLFDIDIIIRRTLQYTVLTGLLAVVYFGSVVVLQSLVEKFSGQQSPVVIVISTLAIVALFNPLRNRIQAFIDLRFYRQKYDAEQALTRFAGSARNEVDLDRLAGALMGVIEETMFPDKVSLWIKKN